MKWREVAPSGSPATVKFLELGSLKGRLVATATACTPGRVAIDAMVSRAKATYWAGSW